MKRRVRKLMALLLASSMIFQQGSTLVFSEETEQVTEAKKSEKKSEEKKKEEKAEKEKEEKNKEEKAEKQTEKQTEAPTEKPTEASTEKPTESSNEKTAEKTAETPTEKPTETSAEKPTEASTEKLTEASTEKPTEASTEKRTEASTEKPTETSTEKSNEASTEKPTEASTEKPTEASTEKPTEASTEKPTEASTEKQTGASTEKPTEAQTEKPTEEPTEKQTEASTEKQTEAPTEKPAEASTEESTETLTEEPTEALTEEQSEEDTKKETESDTRVNDGDKLSAAKLKDYVKEALSYLAVARDYSGAELPEGELLTGDGANRVLTELEDASLILANARTSSSVEVINLYADASGNLDTEPLKELYGSSTIDVSARYAVVNIVASSAAQDLKFSGYDLVYQNAPVSYESVTRAGYVLYNFVALEKDTFTEYQGTVTLSANSQLYGTYLAPSGSVSVNSDLYGAIYADQVKTAENLSLTRIVLIDGRAEETAEELTETVSAEDSEVSAGAVMEGMESLDEGISSYSMENNAGVLSSSSVQMPEETAADTEETSQSESGMSEIAVEQGEMTVEAGTSQSESGTAESAGVQGETTVEAGTSQSESGTAESVGVQQETAAAVEGAAENVLSDTQSSAANEILMEAETEEQEEDSIWYSVSGIRMMVQMVDGDSLAALEEGSLQIRAAEDIVQEDTVIYKKNQEVSTSTWTEGDTAARDVGSGITYEGTYYIEAAEVPEGYLTGSRIYFSVDSQGEAVFDSDETGWNDSRDLLSYPVYKDVEEAPGTDQQETSVVIRLNDGDRTLSGAAFVVKDSKRQLLADQDGLPEYYVTVLRGKAVLEGLAAGTYYLSQVKAPEGYIAGEDIEFTVTEGQTTTVSVTNAEIPEDSNTVTVYAETLYEDTVLTAEEDCISYVALFLDQELLRKATDVKTLTQEAESEVSDTAVFAGLVSGTTYYLSETDEFGTPLGNLEGSKTELTWQVRFREGSDTEQTAVNSITFEKEDPADSDDLRVKTMIMQRRYTEYPEDEFSYTANMKLSLQIRDSKNKEKALTDTFYVTLFRDEERTVKLASPIKISLDNKWTRTLSLSFKMTEESAVYYALETDEKGNVLEGGNGNYEFAVGFRDSVTGEADGSVAVSCGQDAELIVTNTLVKSTLTMKVTDPDGNLLAGAELVLKNADGRVLSVNKVIKFASESEELVWTGILPEGDYYLSEVKAPAGYLPVPDVAFTVESGKATEVVMTNEKASKGLGITAGIQVYAGQDLLYAQDTSSGQYAAEGRYTRYVALFSDKERTQKVTDVMTVTLGGFLGSATFGSLESGKTYYIAETDQYGQVISQTLYGGVLSYTDNGRMTLGNADSQLIVKETYSRLPTGFRYTARLTLEKRVLDSTGNAKTVTDSFYIGIFRNADYSDTPTVVRLDLNNASSGVVTRRVLLSGESDVTYYIAEVDQNGTLITDSSDFRYAPSVDYPQLTLTRSADVKAVVTNTEKVSKVTLYLTKRVYEGSDRIQVTDTFYAGLFQDPNFTQLYTSPVPLNLEDSSSVTLKLSLNLGNASEATIYIAEVDAQGNVVQSSEEFGYEVRMINAAAVFTQDRTEIQTVLLNTVYGTADDDTWSQIYADNGDLLGDNGMSGYDSGYGFGYYGGMSANGDYVGSSEAVQTGDTTPWTRYVILLAASGLLLLAGAAGRKRRA